MRPRWPGCSTIWLRPKLVTPSSARRRTKRFSASGCRRVVAVPSSMPAILRGEQRRDPVDRLVRLVLADDQRGQEADRLGAGRVADEAPLEQRAADDAGRVARNVEADHQPALPHAEDAGRLL